MKSCWIRVGPKSSDWCPYKKGKGHRETKTGEHHGKMEAETGATWLPSRGRSSVARGHQKRGRVILQSLLRERDPTDSLISDFWTQGGERIHSCYFTRPVCGHLLERPLWGTSGLETESEYQSALTNKVLMILRAISVYLKTFSLMWIAVHLTSSVCFSQRLLCWPRLSSSKPVPGARILAENLINGQCSTSPVLMC